MVIDVEKTHDPNGTYIKLRLDAGGDPKSVRAAHEAVRVYAQQCGDFEFAKKLTAVIDVEAKELEKKTGESTVADITRNPASKP